MFFLLRLACLSLGSGHVEAEHVANAAENLSRRIEYIVGGGRYGVSAEIADHGQIVSVVSNHKRV